MAEIERAGEILNRLTQKMGIAARLEQEKAVVLWGEAVGKSVARRARATSIRGGILFVVVENSMWLQELAMLKEGIIGKLNALVGTDVVRDIVFKIGNPKKESLDGSQGPSSDTDKI